MGLYIFMSVCPEDLQNEVSKILPYLATTLETFLLNRFPVLFLLKDSTLKSWVFHLKNHNSLENKQNNQYIFTVWKKLQFKSSQFPSCVEVYYYILNKNISVLKISNVSDVVSGIGKETALDLARRGARVIMACRNLEQANKVRGKQRLA